MNLVYACIDLKSFYASVECRERGLDPLDTNLVVADETRTDGTICLAVTPSLKAYGVPGRARLYKVKEKVRQINLLRQDQLKNRPKRFRGKSCSAAELAQDKTLALDFIIARPQMKLYMKYSAEIYQTYLEFVSSEDILVYSIDEVFIDLTNYLKLYQMDAEELVAKMIEAVHAKTGITATAGIGTNLYLAKVAMDITAKHMEPDQLGVRMASLDETSYREKLWSHQPLTDFWRVGSGYARKLQAHGIRTMGDVARVSIDNEELLFKLFGVNAEFLIDHAWGEEPCTLAAAKHYRATKQSLSEGQVLHGPCGKQQARLITKEMVDALTLKLVEKRLVAERFELMVKYDLGAQKMAPARKTVRIGHRTASARTVMQEMTRAYDEIVPDGARVRRLNVVADEVVAVNLVRNKAEASRCEQLDLFGETAEKALSERRELECEQAERRVQQAMIAIKKRYGKNAILRAMDLEEGATARERNEEVGGHRG